MVNRTLVRLALDQERFSPNGDGRNDTVLLAFGLTLPADVTVEARSRSGAQLVSGPGPFLPGEQALPWDGRLASGARIPDGTYTLAVTAANTSGTVTQGLALAVDTRAPAFRVVSRRPLRIRVSEAATVRLRVDGNRVARSYRRGGVYRAYVNGRRVTGYAEDSAGNRTPVLRLR